MTFCDTFSRGTSIRCSLKIVNAGRSLRVENRRRLDHVPDVAQRLTIGEARRQVVREPGDPAARGEHRDRQDRDRRGQRSRPPRERAPDEASPRAAGA